MVLKLVRRVPPSASPASHIYEIQLPRIVESASDGTTLDIDVTGPSECYSRPTILHNKLVSQLREKVPKVTLKVLTGFKPKRMPLHKLHGIALPVV